MKLSSAIVWFSVCGSTIVYAHNDDRSNPNWLSASASITYREDRVVEDNEAYLIPGIMLGGEAIPPQEDIQYDDLTLQFTKAFGSNALSHKYRISGKLGIHQGHDNQLELDNLWFTLPLFSEKKQVIEIGLMTTMATPTASWHASTSDLSEAPLMSDLFFGRHFSDTGVRFYRVFDIFDNNNENYNIDHYFNFGIEVWQGGNYPATSGDGSLVAYVALETERALANNKHMNGEIRVWGLRADPNQRRDDRYGEGHHSEITTLTSDFFFSGEVVTTGFYANGSINVQQMQWRLLFEWMQQQTNGSLDNQQERSLYDGTLVGYRWLISVAHQSLRFSVQYEEVAIESTFSDAVSSTFINNSGLYNDSHEPERLVYSADWSFMQDLVLRLEYTDENVAFSSERVALGLIWSRGWAL